MAITSEKIVAGVKRRISMPANQVLLNDSDILQFADDIIQSEIIPTIETLNQDYFVYLSEIQLQPSKSKYQIPYRAIGRSLRELKIRNSNNFYRNCPLISIENAYQYQNWSVTVGFYFEGDQIRLIPNVPSTLPSDQFLSVWYMLPPSQLVPVSTVATVTQIIGDTVGVDFVPDDITPTVLIDFVQGKSGNSIYSMDIEVIGTSSNAITFFSPSVIPSDLTAGDFICLAGTSPVANFIPNECYPLIESLTSKRCLKAIGDYEGARMLEDDIQTERKNIQMILQPRIEGEPTIIINPYSIARSNLFNQRSWLYGQ